MKTVFKKVMLLVIFTAAITVLVACGNTSLKGDLTEYSDPGSSFTISLPAEDTDSWAVKDDTQDDTLDMTDSTGVINIQVQSMSKSKAANIASDLTGFRDYIMSGTLSEIVSDMTLSDESVSVPDFITDSSAQSFTMSSSGTSLKGDLVFMESDRSYYLFMITAVDKAYDGNHKVLTDSISSLKEK